VWCARRPKAVTLVPGEGELTWKWRDGLLTATLDSLHIHSAIVVEV
jgi:hypothetical protein